VKRLVVSSAVVLALLSMGVELASCNEPAATVYGNPNTLDRKNLPGEGGAAPLECPEAGVKYDGGDCPSFAADIFPYLTPAGKWKCSDTTACHATGGTTPIIDTTSPATCYASLQKATVAGKPYFPTGDGGANLSETTGFLCNLQGGCGSKMPKPPGTDPLNEELCKIDQWLKCGAPR
jgi:hypothetical protein